MNFFQALNAGVFVATLAALFAGLAKIPVSFSERPLTLWLFVALFFVLRFKMCMDDHKYFNPANARGAHFKIGFFVGMTSWFFWALGAWSVGEIHEAYLLTGIALCISTLWIFAVVIRQGFYKEQYIWLVSNTSIVLLLVAAYLRDLPDGDYLTWIFIGGALVIVLADLVLSDSVPELQDLAQPVEASSRSVVPASGSVRAEEEGSGS